MLCGALARFDQLSQTAAGAHWQLVYVVSSTIWWSTALETDVCMSKRSHLPLDRLCSTSPLAKRVHHPYEVPVARGASPFRGSLRFVRMWVKYRLFSLIGRLSSYLAASQLTPRSMISWEARCHFEKSAVRFAMAIWKICVAA